MNAAGHSNLTNAPDTVNTLTSMLILVIKSRATLALPGLRTSGAEFSQSTAALPIVPDPRASSEESIRPTFSQKE